MRNTHARPSLVTLLFLGLALQPLRGALGSERRAPGQDASAPTQKPEPSSQSGSEATDDLAAKLAAIEKAVDARRRRLHVPGASLVIVKGDQVISLKGFGFRDLECKLPVTPKTLFAIGSSTKAFTAMTVMMSVDDGKLSLEDSPKKYLSYFRLRDPEADGKITISDLLCHRSGLDRTDISWYTGVLRPREVIQVAGLAKPTAKLGEKWQYQNVMFLAAGEIVAKVQKSSWRKVVARRIFRPLGMTATNTSIREMQRSPDYALGYTYDEETKQTIQAPGQPAATLEPASGRRYRIAPPAPPNSFVTFRPSQKDPQASELLLEQGGGSITVVLPKRAEVRPAEFTPLISVEELMRNVIEAAGGEANLRKHRTMAARFDVDFENQGLAGRGVLLSRAPNAMAETVTIFGMGKKLGTLREYYDGAQGGAEASFSPPAPKTGKQLADAAIAADFSQELNWKSLFKTVQIRKLSKLGDDEVYEVRKTPEKGSPVTDYISTRSFLLLKRDSMIALPGNLGALPMSETFSDYRVVDGVRVPFARARTLPEMGSMLVTVREVKFDVRLPHAAFRPGARK